MTRVAVIGTGAAGLATAASLALAGHSVRIANRGPRGLEEIGGQGGVKIENPDESTVTLPVQAAASIAEAVGDSEVAILAVGGGGEDALLRDLAPHLGTLELVVTISGRAGAGPTCAQAIADAGGSIRAVGEMAFPFVATEERPGVVRIHGRKRWTAMTCAPENRSEEALATVRAMFDIEIERRPFLWPSLHCVPGLTIPLLALTNAGPIARGEQFSFYRDGGFRDLDRLVEEIDRERSLIGERVGLRTISSTAWFNRTYGLACSSVSEVFATNPAYEGRAAPASLNHRYLTDHVPLCVVPLVALGRRVGVKTPLLDGIATFASALIGQDLWSMGSARADWIRTLPGPWSGPEDSRKEDGERWQATLSELA